MFIFRVFERQVRRKRTTGVDTWRTVSGLDRAVRVNCSGILNDCMERVFYNPTVEY